MLKNLTARLTAPFSRRERGPLWLPGPGEMVVVLSPEGRILKVSPAARTLLWRKPESLLGRALSDFVWRDDHAALRKAIAEAGKGNAPPTTLRFHHPQKAALWTDVIVRAERGGRLRALVRDRGGLHARERALRQSAERAQAEAAARADLLADLSHEMKTPLNSILGFADAMREETFGPLGCEKYDEYVNLIHGSGKHLMSLITTVLDLARIEADRYALKPEIANAGALARECVEMIRLDAEKAGLAVKTDVAPNIPDSLLDARAVRQILLNLLSNAVKFTGEGGITVTVRAEGDALQLDVKDTGVGMSAEQIAGLGARFTAVQGDGVRGAKGAGLGLSLAFALAELHGGALTLESAPGEGLLARLRLPLRTPKAIGEEDAHAAGAPASFFGASSRESSTVAPLRADQDVAPAAAADGEDILTQLERIEAYRRETAARHDSGADAA
ncbi:MAG: PAS domain-containing sensor histidine kinase [Parvularculaceae bacterium]